MSKNGFWVVLSLAASLSGGSVFAGDFGVEVNKDPTPPHPPAAGRPTVSASVSWEELKERCLHPKQFDSQTAPQNIKVQCADTHVEFIPATAGQLAPAASRTVVSSVLSDKFHVAAGSTVVPAAVKPLACMKFKEVERSLTVERPLSCNELLGIKGDLAEYCASSLDHAKASNPKVVQVRDTGRVIDTCATANIGGQK